MQLDDLPAAATVTAAAFELDISNEADRQRWQDRVAHALRTDPQGGLRGRSGR